MVEQQIENMGQREREKSDLQDFDMPKAVLL